MKIRLVGAELFHAYRRTEMSKLIDASRSFANAQKTSQLMLYAVIIAVFFF